MKVSVQKKNMRKAFAITGKECPNCKQPLQGSGHFVPALGIWICQPPTQPNLEE